MGMVSYPSRTSLFLYLTIGAAFITIYYVHSVNRFTKHSPSTLFDYRDLIVNSDEAATYFKTMMYEHDPFYDKSPPNFTEVSPNVDVQPNYRGLPDMCDTQSPPGECNSEFHRCIKISVVGLCGHWSNVGLLRVLPATFSCDNLTNTTILLDHAGKAPSIQKSDIVVFSFVNYYLDMNVWRSLRHFRPEGQMWVFQTEESPFYAIGLLPPWIYRNDSFDISSTYRTAADVYSPYGYYEPFRMEESNQMEDLSSFTENKTRFMVWISSHCETLQWDRTRFVYDLQRSMPVDIFGRCGNGSVLCKARWQSDCNKKVDEFVKTYKFSLALENSCCEDYITEKLWHSYAIGNVPVVVGPKIKNYEILAPPGSFIHADRFESLEALKKYLKYLDGNDTAYLEYFKWRNLGNVREHSIKEHFQSHLSNPTMCSIVDKYMERKNMTRDENDDTRLKMFDPYGPEWKGTCHSCGYQKWIKEYEHPIDHKRKFEWIWAR